MSVGARAPVQPERSRGPARLPFGLSSSKPVFLFSLLLFCSCGGPAKTLDGGFDLGDAGVADAGEVDAGLPDAGPPRRQCLAVVRSVRVLANDGGAFVCAGTQDLVGRVSVAVNDAGTFRLALSVCGDDGGCVPREVRISSDPAPAPPSGTEVRVHLVSPADAGCRTSALVTSADGTVWLAAGSGAFSPAPESPFRVGIFPEAPPFSCVVNGFLACGTGFITKLSFAGRDGGTSSGPLAQGESGGFDVLVDGGVQHLVGTNWSSMSFGGCDDAPGYNWVVTPAP